MWREDFDVSLNSSQGRKSQISLQKADNTKYAFRRPPWTNYHYGVRSQNQTNAIFSKTVVDSPDLQLDPLKVGLGYNYQIGAMYHRSQNICKKVTYF